MKRILTILIVLASLPGFGQTSEGPNSPGATIQTGWTNPNNVFSSDNNYATKNLTDEFVPFGVSNFGFTIPAGATINGIVVTIERKSGRASRLVDNIVSLYDADGNIITENKASATSWGTSDATISYGANNDLWSETWTAADINDSDFGIYLRIEGYGGGSTASLDHFTITVYYTETASSSFAKVAGVAYSSTAKVSGVAKASIGKIMGIE